MFEITPNRTMFARAKGFKAELDGQLLATGNTKAECRDHAVAYLEERLIAANKPVVVRVARDGSVLVARWIANGQMEYGWHRAGRYSGICFGLLPNHFAGSLERYMDHVLGQYDECTATAEVA